MRVVGLNKFLKIPSLHLLHSHSQSKRIRLHQSYTCFKIPPQKKKEKKRKKQTRQTSKLQLTSYFYKSGEIGHLTLFFIS